MTPMPIIKLSNGLLVGNLTSGHTFEFEDGSVLPACERDRVEAGKLDIHEYVGKRWVQRSDCEFEFNTIQMTVIISQSCRLLIEDATKAFESGQVHVVLVPLMLLQALKDEGYDPDKRTSAMDFCYVIRKNGRDVDGQRAKICIDRFCV